eukprot:6189449-Pleurochrysis_carterae.AAC.1
MRPAAVLGEAASWKAMPRTDASLSTEARRATSHCGITTSGKTAAVVIADAQHLDLFEMREYFGRKTFSSQMQGVIASAFLSARLHEATVHVSP